MTRWAARVLDEVDAAAGAAERRLAELVAVPSIGGTDPEHEIQAMLAAELAAAGLETDHWRLPLDRAARRPRTSPASRSSGTRRGASSAGCPDAATGRP